jgi:predicted transcriptional regulator
MSQWVDRVKQHPASADLALLEAAVSASKVSAEADETAFEAWARIDRVVRFVRAFMSQVDPLLVPLPALANSQGQIQAARAQVEAYEANKNVAHLNEANNNLDNVLTSLGNVPTLDAAVGEIGEATAAYQSAVSDFLRGTKAQVDALKVERDALSQRITELAAEVAAQKARADSVIAQLQQQFSEAQADRQTKAAAAEEERAKIFKQSQEHRDADELKASTGRQSAFIAYMDATKATQELQSGKWTESVDSLIADIEKQKAQAEKIVGIISMEAVSHGYGKTANEERDSATTWRWVAVVALVCWIVAGCVFFALTYDKDLSLSALARQFLISTPFVLLAGFAALQVSKHQKAERFNRQQELEIAAIDPYLASFDEPSKIAVKRELADKLFGQRDAEPTKGESSQVAESVSETLKVVKQIQGGLQK